MRKVTKYCGMMALFLFLCACATSLPVTPKQLSHQEEICLAFVQNHMTEDGGIRTNYYDKPPVAELATGREVLSESQGLMMLYAAEALNRPAFDAAYAYTRRELDNGKIFAYRWNPEGQEPFTINAAVDDLRIIKALYRAGEGFSDSSLTRAADQYAKRFYKTNVEYETLYDFYDTAYYMKNDFVTLCYLDLEALALIGQRQNKYLPVYENAQKLLEGGYISDEFPMFMTRYSYKKQKYEAPDGIHMVESVLTAYNLSFAGKCPEATVAFLKKALRGGKIYASYTLEGQPKNQEESTAIYALTAMLALNLGDREMYDRSIALMNRWMVTNKNQTLYGAFGDENDVYSFDQLTALLAYRKGAVQ